MKSTNLLTKLKELSKYYARARQLPLHQARDLVARVLTFAHWNDLTKANRGDWSPTQDQLASVENLLTDNLPLPNSSRADHGSYIGASVFDDDVQEGTINGQKYRISVSFGDAYMRGAGWHIHVPEAPNRAPLLELAKQIEHEGPIHEPDFQRQAVEVALARSEQVRSGIASDWPRRSTKPDKDGRVRHPLGKAESDTWYCLHCDFSISGVQIAKSLWRCPSCDESPLDIHERAWWLEDGDAPPKPLADSDMNGRPDLMVDVVDSRLKLELDAKKITLLTRSALVENATNASERLGALYAGIEVDEDNDVWITFDEDLWPDEKEPVSALVVAGLLGIEVEESLCLRDLPFAWPG